MSIVYATGNPTIPYGVISLTPKGKSVPSGVLTHPYVDGVSLRSSWQEIELSEDNYDWSYLDTQISRVANAGKPIILRMVSGGQNTPPWVFNLGVQTFSFTNKNKYQGNYNEVVTIPVFWDPVFLKKKKKFIRAMSDHYQGNKDIISVVMECANSLTDDWNVPSQPDDVKTWKTIGYTSEKLINVCKQIIDTVSTEFPNQTVLLSVAPNGGDLDPDPNYVARNVVAYGREAYPGRFIVQKNSLSANIPNPTLLTTLGPWQIIYNNQPMTGGQMLWNVTNDASCRMNGNVKPCDPATILRKAVTLGTYYGMRYQEIYQVDILNNDLASVIRDAAELLAPSN
jgi:hypothetical protein